MRQISRIASLLAWCLTVMFAAPIMASFKTAETMEGMAKRADVVAVITVVSVERDPSGLQVAVARVREMWKGVTDGEEVRFHASQFDPCDLSRAAEGEQLLVFLYRHTGGSVLSIFAAGRGRFELGEKDGEVVIFTHGFEPMGMRTIPVVDPSGAMAEAVPMSILRGALDLWLRPAAGE